MVIESIAQKENQILNFWDSNKIYEKVKGRYSPTSRRKVFYFLDGPPYVSGDLHPGQIWIKCLKDAVLRYKRFFVYVHDRPGFDTHGLPIETKVEKKLGIQTKKEIENSIGVEKFIEECKLFVNEYMERMIKDYKKFGIWMDWNDPYITYSDTYISKTLKTIKAAYSKGLLEKGLKPIAYCSRCQTALANAEIVYSDIDDPSIFIKFRVLKTKNPMLKDSYLVAWTTTPWTLVSNVALAVNPDADYVVVKYKDEKLVFAEARKEFIERLLNAKFEVLHKLKGSEISAEYEPILPLSIQNFEHKVVQSSEIVNLNEGSGIVHIAPGHGPEDYLLGLKYKLRILSPVNEEGKFTSDAEKYSGIPVREASPIIISDLKEKGKILFSTKIRHSYPHCWRCNSPLIFTSLPQWFIKVTKIKPKLDKITDKIKWKPDSLKTAFRNSLDSAIDWTISRQRYWGIPLPIWECQKCGRIKVFGSKEEIEKEYGKPLKDLHRPYIDEVALKCECGGEMRRVKDVLDVWVDSGNATWASLKDNEDYFPVDFIVEGKDQIRGWFYSTLVCGYLVFGKPSYRFVMRNGFMLDENGREMHKSLGNFVPLSEILSKSSADGFRLWLLSHPFEDDLLFKWSEIEQANSELMIFYNLVNFAKELGPAGKASKPKPKFEEDRWLISKTNTLVKNCRRYYEDYDIYLAAKEIRKFLVEDLSRFYVKLLKNRIKHAEAKEEKDASAFFYALNNAVLLLSPIIPMFAEYAYQELFRAKYKKESVFLLNFPKPDESLIDGELESSFEHLKDVVSQVFSEKQKMGIKLRWPVEKVSISTQDTSKLQPYIPIIKYLSNAKEVELLPSSGRRIKPLFEKLGPVYKNLSQKIGDALKQKTFEELEKDNFELQIDSQRIKITKDLFEVLPESGQIKIVFDKEKMKGEILQKEILREIQKIRKQLKLKKGDELDIAISPSNLVSGKLLQKYTNTRLATDCAGSKQEFKIKVLDVEVTIKIC